MGGFGRAGWSVRQFGRADGQRATVANGPMQPLFQRGAVVIIVVVHDLLTFLHARGKVDRADEYPGLSMVASHSDAFSGDQNPASL